MLPKIEKQELDSDHLGPLPIERCLFEFDGPRTFISRDKDGELLLLHQYNETQEAWHYVVVPFSEALLENLVNGKIDLRTALDQPRLWITDITQHGPSNVFRVTNNQTLDPYLPVPGTMLFPEQESLLSVRSIGRGVELGEATLGVLRNALDNVRSALRSLATYAVGESPKPGQPRAATRRYYELPALIQSGSLIVSVRPEENKQGTLFDSDIVWDRMEELLQLGISEIEKKPVSDQSEEPPIPIGDELRVALQAMYLLAPPAYGAVETTEISGRLVQSTERYEPLQLTRETRSILQKRLRLEVEDEPRYVTDSGFISECDREEATCLLRNDDGKTLRKIFFESQFYDQVKEAFDTNKRVEVIVLENSLLPDTSDLIVIQFKHDQESDSNRASGQLESP